MTTADIIQGNREEIKRIAAQYGASEIRVFGSTARGDSDAESDIDLLVRLEPGCTLMRRAALVRELEALLCRKVDVVSDRGIRNRIRERILKEAVPL